jgi:uncharacterized surface protein with fasciclin (FAS1) repeats
MVSCYPETQNYNFTHMSSFVDYRNPDAAEMCVNKGSIYDYINSNPIFSKFRTIVQRANMLGQLNQPQADFTVMIPPNDHLQHIPEDYFAKMDDGLARQILKASCINRVIDKNLITSSPVSYYYTQNKEMRMYVTNIGGRTEINNCCSIIQYDISLNNGMVHIIDGLIVPSNAHFMN